LLSDDCSAGQLLLLQLHGVPASCGWTGSHHMCSCALRAHTPPRLRPQADTEKSALETAIDNARETCEGGATGECANAWDDVEELSAEMGHKRERAKENKKDVLEE
jgi:CP12 domain